MVCVCQPQSQGQWFWSVHHYGDFESDQESFHKKSVLELFLTLFSGREGWAAWPSAPSHVAYFLRNLCTSCEETSVAPQKSQRFSSSAHNETFIFLRTYIRNLFFLQSPPGLPHLWEDWIVRRSERSLILVSRHFLPLPVADWLITARRWMKWCD